jgi:F-type H+-transporting ATPase subunit b
MSLIEVLAEQPAGKPEPAFPHAAEIILGFVAFSVLVYLVGKYLWPSFVSSFDDTTTKIESGIERADKDQEDAQAQLERSRTKLAGVDTDTARIRDDARADAERIGEDMDAKAREEADRIVAQGHQSLEASRSRTVSDLRTETGRQSVELAQRIVQASLSDESARAESIDRFLGELEAMGGSDGAQTSGASASGNGTSNGSGNGVGGGR